MAVDHGDPKAGQLRKAWSRGRKETESCLRAAAQRGCSWTVQNEMRGVLGRVSEALQKVLSILPILER